LNVVQKFMTLNDCYTKNQRLVSVDYLIVHSTATPGIMAEAWYSRWNKTGVAKCVHAFVDDKVVMQYLPWLWRAWQIGTSWGNSHSIGCEMCEDKLWEESYFLKAKMNMVELYAMLAKTYNVPVNKIVGHYEAHTLGIGSNHGDPRHWWSKFGYTMDDFRNEVKEAMNTMVNYNEGVKKLQQDLNKLGYALTVDGLFGPGTKEVVSRFQKDNRLDVDGSAGPITLAKIAELLRVPVVIVPTPSPVTLDPNWICDIEVVSISFEEAKALKNKYPGTKIIIK